MADTKYRLVEFRPEDGAGRGFSVRSVSDGIVIPWRSLPRDEGLRSISLVGERFRADALQLPAFDIGQPLALVREPDNPHDPNAVAVYDYGRQHHAGYLPADEAREIAPHLDAGTAFRCYSMWEVLEGRRRTELRVLILEEGASLEMSGDPAARIPYAPSEEGPTARGEKAETSGCLGALVIATLLIVVLLVGM